MDFSEAECGGFIGGFIIFWMMQSDNTHTHQELQAAAEHLLKGCREHFRAGVTHISRISGVVAHGMKEEFSKCALALMDAPNSQEFISHAGLLVRDFPRVASWMEWWMRPAHASMLFESERKMDIDLWNSLPPDSDAAVRVGPVLTRFSRTKTRTQGSVQRVH